MCPIRPGGSSRFARLPMYLGLTSRGVHFLLHGICDASIAKEGGRPRREFARSLRGQERASQASRERATAFVIRFRDAATRDKARADQSASRIQNCVLTDASWGARCASRHDPPEAQRHAGIRAQQDTRLCTTHQRVGVFAEPDQQQGRTGVGGSWASSPAEDTARPRRSSGAPRPRGADGGRGQHKAAALRRSRRAGFPFGDELLHREGRQPLLVKKQVVLKGRPAEPTRTKGSQPDPGTGVT